MWLTLKISLLMAVIRILGAVQFNVSDLSQYKDDFHEWVTSDSFDSFRGTHTLRMLSYMNKSVDPCVDFFEFACGNFGQAVPMELYYKGTVSMSTFQEDMSRFMMTRILSRPSEDTDSTAEVKAKIIFQSCINFNLSKSINCFTSLMKAFSLWPAFDQNWTESSFDWLKVAALARIQDFQTLFTVTVEDGVYQFLPEPMPEYWMNVSSSLSNFTSYFIQTLGILRLNESEISQMSVRVYNFEKKVAKLLEANGLLNTTNGADGGPYGDLSEEELSEDLQNDFLDVLVKGRTMRKLKRFIPDIRFEEYIRVIFHEELRPATVVQIGAEKFMRKLGKLIGKTDNRTLADFFFWRIAHSILLRLDLRLYPGETATEKCSSYVIDNLSSISVYLAAKHIFAAKDRMKVQAITRLVAKEARKKIRSIHWLDRETRDHALRKVDAIRYSIGFPNYETLEDDIGREFHYLQVKESNFLTNQAFVAVHQFGRKYGTMQPTPTDHPLEVNACFTVPNEVHLNMGYLMPPYYSKYTPTFHNYAVLGATIGHEMMHSFDPTLIQFDAQGNNRRWYNSSLTQHYNRSLECFNSRYQNLTGVSNKKNKVIGENIPDQVGLDLAFRAYKKILKTDDMQGYDNLELDNLQAFFLANAQDNCETPPTEIIDDSYPPNRIRVLATLSNSADFAKAFNCPVGSPMNPNDQKCSFTRR